MKQSPSTRSPCSQGGIRLISCWKLKQVATAMIARACIVAEHVHRSVVFARWRPYVPRRTRCSLSPRESSNCISIGSAVFAEFIRVTSQYRQTDRQTHTGNAVSRRVYRNNPMAIQFAVAATDHTSQRDLLCSDWSQPLRTGSK